MWKEWKAIYTNANHKAIVKRMAADYVKKFGGAANGCARGNRGAAAVVPNPLQLSHPQ